MPTSTRGPPRDPRGGEGAHPIDVLVGSRIRSLRTTRGLSQTALAEAAGLTFQQIHRYERGNDRVSASRLWTFARTLDVPVTFFFQAAQTDGAPDASDAPEARALMQAYLAIDDRRLQKAILQLTKALAERPSGPRNPDRPPVGHWRREAQG